MNCLGFLIFSVMCKLYLSVFRVLDVLLTFLGFKFGMCRSPVRVQGVGCATHLLGFRVSDVQLIV